VCFGGDHLLGGMQSYVEAFGSNFRVRCNLSPNDQVQAFASVDGTFAGQYLQEKLSTQAGWSTPMPDEDWTSGQQGMIQAFCASLARGERVTSDGKLGRDVVEIVYAAYVSAATGARVRLS
jgi:predicted dehydrogenase